MATELKMPIDDTVDAAGSTLVPFKGCGLLGEPIRFGPCIRCGHKLTDRNAPFTIGRYQDTRGYLCRPCRRKVGHEVA